MSMDIAHALSVQSDFSIGRSLLQTSQIVERAVELGYKSVALVDDMSVHAMVDLMGKAKAAGIQAIAGCRLRMFEDSTYKKPSKASGKEEKLAVTGARRTSCPAAIRPFTHRPKVAKRD